MCVIVSMRAVELTEGSCGRLTRCGHIYRISESRTE